MTSRRRRCTCQRGLRLGQRVTVHDVGHLAAAGSVVRDDDEVVDGAARQVVVHQTDGAVGRPRRATAATTLARRLEVHHGLQVRAPHASYTASYAA